MPRQAIKRMRQGKAREPESDELSPDCTKDGGRLKEIRNQFGG